MTPGTSVLDECGLFVDRPTAVTTYSGRVIDPVHPDPDDIDIEDIAHHLSQQCRFSGACDRFYSVAEHSLRVARLVDAEHKLAALLHDGSESYIADLAKPVKESGELCGYRLVEQRFEAAIQIKFDLPIGPWPAQVKAADHRMFQVEAKLLCPRGVGRFVEDIEIEGDEWPSCWSPRVAEGIFLDEFTHYYALRERQKEQA